MKDEYLPWLVLLFPVVFACFWTLMAGILAQMGWAKFARRFASDRPVPDRAQRHLWGSLSIGRSFGSASYNNCINIWIDDQALYLRPSLLFRPFHSLLRVNWRDIASVGPRRVFFVQRGRVAGETRFASAALLGPLGPRRCRALAFVWRRQPRLKPLKEN